MPPGLQPAARGPGRFVTLLGRARVGPSVRRLFNFLSLRFLKRLELFVRGASLGTLGVAPFLFPLLCECRFVFLRGLRRGSAFVRHRASRGVAGHEVVVKAAQVAFFRHILRRFLRVGDLFLFEPLAVLLQFLPVRRGDELVLVAVQVVFLYPFL